MKKVFDFLEANFICAVATTSGDKPRASIVDYYMAGDAIIIGTSPDSIKANNLKANPRISMAVHNMPLFLTIDGKVAEASKAEIEEYMKQLFVKRPEFKAMAQDGMMPFVFYKVAIDTVYYNDYSKGMAPTEVIKA